MLVGLLCFKHLPDRTQTEGSGLKAIPLSSAPAESYYAFQRQVAVGQFVCGKSKERKKVIQLFLKLNVNSHKVNSAQHRECTGFLVKNCQVWSLGSI